MNYQLPKAKITKSNFWFTNKPHLGIKCLLVLFFIVAGTLSAKAQIVINGQRVFSSQNDIDRIAIESLPSTVTEITGLVLIRGNDITDLTPLSSLTSVGALVIESNPLLTNLNGLENITSVGGGITGNGLEINSNPNLTDISGLRGVIQAPDGVIIGENPQLTSLNGLQIVNTDRLQISDNNNLVNLNGLNTLVTASSIQILRNPSLTNISALSGIPVIPNDVLITENTSLTTLSGLQFTSADRVIIQGNNSLLNVNGLQNLVSVTTILQILQNPQLTDLSGLNSVAIADQIQISENNTLPEINGFNSLISTNSITIESNPLLNNFCGLQPWAIANPTSIALNGPIGNAYNPSMPQLITACNGAAATTDIGDPEFERYLADNGLDNDPIVGKVLTSDIEVLTQLSIIGYNISDFSGLEDFTALETFDMSNNNSGNINLIDFSQNKNLTRISIGTSNNLSAININGADALENLQITRGNNLTSLDVTNNLNLNFLNVVGNSITILNLQNNILLKDIAIRDLPQLTSLSFTKNLEGLILDNTDLQSLDLTDMTLLGTSAILSPSLEISNNANLQTFELSNSQVESVNLSSNIALETIELNLNRALTNFILPPVNSPLRIFEFTQNTGYINTLEIKDRTQLESILIFSSGTDEIIIENLPKLTSLTIDEHVSNLTRLQIKNNPGLTSFRFRNNLRLLDVEIENNINLQTLEGTSAGSTLERLERLSVVENNLRALDISRLNSVETLSVRQNPNLAALDLTSINNGAPNSLITFEGENTGITQLDFSTSPNIDIIRLGYNAALGGTPLSVLNLQNGNNIAISELNTSGNYPALSCIQVDAGIVGTNPVDWVKDTQTQLLANCNQQNICQFTASVAQFFEAYLENPANTFFDAQGNQVFPSDGITGNNLVCLDAIALIDELNIDGTISTVEIVSFNGISNFSALTKFKLRATPVGLTTLDLASNTSLVEIDIRDTGIENMTLPTNTAVLQKVTLSQNNLSGGINLSGNTALTEIQAIQSSFSTVNTTNCTALQILNFDNGSISQLDLSTNTNLRELILDTNPITDLELTGVVYPNLTNIVVTRSRIENLTIRNTAINSIILSEMNNLKRVDIEENSILNTISMNNPGFEPTSIERLSLRANDLIGTLDISGLNNITTIDVSGNANLTTLDLTDQVNLEFLTTFQSGISVIDLSTNNGTLSEVTVGTPAGNSNLTSLNLNNNNLVYSLIALATDNNLGLSCIEVNSVFDAEQAVNQGFWSVPSNQNFSLNCSVSCNAIVFTDANLKAFFLDAANSNKILDLNNNPITDLVVGNEVCAEKAANVYTLNLRDGYNGNLFTNLAGLEAFTNLRDLDISNNNFNPLHVRNVTLERLIADNCVDNTFDVLFQEDPNDSNSAFLVNVNEFSFQDNWENQANAVGPITFSGVPNAQIVNIDGSNIAGVNFTNTVWNSLEELYANNSSIESMSGINTAISIRRIEASNSNLTGSIDLTNNGNLEVFEANEANISSLTVSNANISLARISIFGQGQNNNTLNAVNFNQTLPSLSSLDVSDNNNLSLIDLTKTPFLETFQSFETNIPRLDFTALQSAGSGNFFISDNIGANGSLTEIDIRNNNPSFVLSDFELDFAGHPNLNCVLVNQSDLATAQGLIGGVWSNITADKIKTTCQTAIPTIQWGTVTSTIEGETVNQPVVIVNGEVPAGGLDLSFGLVTGGTAQATPAASPQGELDDFNFVSGGTAPVSYAFGIGEGSYDGSNPVTYQLLNIYEDNRYEGNESIRIEIQTTDLTIIGNPILEYSIIDDDYRIEVVAGNDFNENGGSSNFSFTLTDENGNAVFNQSGQDIQITWLDIENAQQGSDYSLSGNGVIENGQQSTTIEINGIDDNLFEGQEFAGLELQEGQGYFVDINTLPRTSLAINDNDNNIVFSASQIGLEDARDVGFTLAFEDENGNAATNSTVNSLGFDIVLTSGNGANSAILGTDFANGLKDIAGNSVFIEPGQSSTTFEVVVIDDQDDENRENFLANISTPETEVILANTQVTAFIDDNDGQVEDSDNDGISDTTDNCPNTSNTNQADLDNDGIGDVCDPDIDGDGVLNADDAFPENPNESMDTDGDGVSDNGDNCPNNANADQADTDGDGIGDVCETANNDADNDGILDNVDNCPNTANTNQADLDNDGTGDICDQDIDGDGVLNIDDDCPYQVGQPADNGCPLESNTIDQEDIKILVLSETCPGQDNGSFLVNIENEEYTFNVLLDGTNIGTADSSNALEYNGLAYGEYQICITVDQQPNFEQCFGIQIKTFERLLVNTNGIDSINLKATFNIAGSREYDVLVNDQLYKYQTSNTNVQTIEVPIEQGTNSVIITGKSDCQGTFTDTIQVGNVFIYPNPLIDILNFKGFIAEGDAQIMVHNLSGQLLLQKSIQLNAGTANINLSDLPEGLYLIRVTTLKEKIEFKIIKE